MKNKEKKMAKWKEETAKGKGGSVVVRPLHPQPELPNVRQQQDKPNFPSGRRSIKHPYGGVLVMPQISPGHDLTLRPSVVSLPPTASKRRSLPPNSSASTEFPQNSPPPSKELANSSGSPHLVATQENVPQDRSDTDKRPTASQLNPDVVERSNSLPYLKAAPTPPGSLKPQSPLISRKMQEQQTTPYPMSTIPLFPTRLFAECVCVCTQ